MTQKQNSKHYELKPCRKLNAKKFEWRENNQERRVTIVCENMRTVSLWKKKNLEFGFESGRQIYFILRESVFKEKNECKACNFNVSANRERRAKAKYL